MVILTYQKDFIGSNYITFKLWDKIFFKKYKKYILKNSSNFKPIEEVRVNIFSLSENKILEKLMKTNPTQFIKDLKNFK